MKPVMFQDANREYVIPGDKSGQTKMPVRYGLSEDANLGWHPSLTSVWDLDDNERATVAAGGYVVLTLFSENLPPIALGTTIEQGDGEEARAQRLLHGSQMVANGLVAILTEYDGDQLSAGEIVDECWKAAAQVVAANAEGEETNDD